jgi:hypothetical protein
LGIILITGTVLVSVSLVKPEVTALELIEQVAICPSDFNAVESGVHSVSRRFFVFRDNTGDFLYLEGSRRYKGSFRPNQPDMSGRCNWAGGYRKCAIQVDRI